MEQPLEEQTFDTLCEAISFAFRHEQTSMLSLDRICRVLNSPNLFINSKSNGPVPCSSVTRRKVSSTLSSSELFVRAGPPRACLWAIRPHNPLFLSDSVISASIEQMLTSSGPMTIQQFVQSTDLSGADASLFERVLSEHTTEFTSSEDGTWWFAGQERPASLDFESICHALLYAFSHFANGASIEELHWLLCLSTVGGTKRITRRCVSRELSRRQDLFTHLSRARYGLIEKPTLSVRPNSLPVRLEPQLTCPMPLGPSSNQAPLSPPHTNRAPAKPLPSVEITNPPKEIPVPSFPTFFDQNDENAKNAQPDNYEDDFDPNSFFNNDSFFDIQ